jgi:hypothetical protein
MKRLTLLILGALTIWFAGRESGRQAATKVDTAPTTTRSSSSTADIAHAYHGVDLGVPTDHSTPKSAQPAAAPSPSEAVSSVAPASEPTADIPNRDDSETDDSIEAKADDTAKAPMAAATVEEASDIAQMTAGPMKPAAKMTAAVASEDPSPESPNQLASGTMSDKQVEILAAIGLTADDVIVENETAKTKDHGQPSTATEEALVTETEAEAEAAPAEPVSRYLQDLHNRLEREAAESQ